MFERIVLVVVLMVVVVAVVNQVSFGEAWSELWAGFEGLIHGLENSDFTQGKGE